MHILSYLKRLGLAGLALGLAVGLAACEDKGATKKMEEGAKMMKEGAEEMMGGEEPATSEEQPGEEEMDEPAAPTE